MSHQVKNVEKALNALRQGKMIVLTDSPERENEGDWLCAAQFATPDIVNFMIRNGSGIVCLALPPERCAQLGLSLMVSENHRGSVRGTPFTISIDANPAKYDVTTGVSSHDRAVAIGAAVGDDASENDFVVPGHILPLQGDPRGLAGRNGHTEGSLELMALAGLKPASVICEVMHPNGQMARGECLHALAREHDILVVSIDDVLAYKQALLAEHAVTAVA